MKRITIILAIVTGFLLITTLMPLSNIDCNKCDERERNSKNFAPVNVKYIPYEELIFNYEKMLKEIEGEEENGTKN